jgi:hypothetical protein
MGLSVRDKSIGAMECWLHSNRVAKINSQHLMSRRTIQI